MAVRVAMALRGEHQGHIAQVLGVDRSAVSGRLNGRIAWSLDDLDKLAAHWGCGVVDLVEPALPMGLQRTPSGAISGGLPSRFPQSHVRIVTAPIRALTAA